MVTLVIIYKVIDKLWNIWNYKSTEVAHLITDTEIKFNITAATLGCHVLIPQIFHPASFRLYPLLPLGYFNIDYSS